MNSLTLGRGLSPARRRPSFLSQLSLWIYRARFLVQSLFFHCVLVLLGGSAVLYHSSVEPPDFEAGGGIVGEEMSIAPPPDQPPQIDPATSPSPASPAMTAPSLSAIVSTAVTPSSFQLATLSERPSMSNSLVDPASLADSMARAARKGMGAGVAGGSMRFFGMKEKTPSALVGTFYDLKQTRRKKPSNVSPDEYHKTFRRFVKENWRESILDDYFRAPQPLYTTQIMIPDMAADEGPKAFDMEKEVQPSRWLVHYKGRVSPPADGTYHFVGAGDDVMLVRFNGKTVLDRCWAQADQEWQPERNYNYGWTAIPNGFAKGDAIRVKAGQFYEMEVLIGEQPGGKVFACLLMEEEGVEYRKDARGNPILPIFRLAETPAPEPKEGQTFPPFAADGPVWRAQGGKTSGGSALDVFGPKM